MFAPNFPLNILGSKFTFFNLYINQNILGIAREVVFFFFLAVEVAKN